MKIVAICAAILLPAAISAAPASAALQSDATKSDVTNPDDKPVCRRVDTVGTRLAPRVCATKAQWKERDEANRAAARQRADKAERN